MIRFSSTATDMYSDLMDEILSDKEEEKMKMDCSGDVCFTSDSDSLEVARYSETYKKMDSEKFKNKLVKTDGR